MFHFKIKSVFVLIISLFLYVNLIACNDRDSSTENQLTSSHHPTAVHEELTKPFDYYLLALSWSPTYCKNHTQDKGQCDRKPEMAYHFILHGLWPSNKERGNPFFCSTEKLSDAAIQEIFPTIPTKRLIQHEWQKHGTCSGFDSFTYFELSKNAFNKVKVPDFFNKINKPLIKKTKEIKDAFVQENPGLKYNAIRISNVKGILSEVRICLDSKALATIDCPFPPSSRSDRDLTILPPGKRKQG